jgi:3'-5' exonuclease
LPLEVGMLTERGGIVEKRQVRYLVFDVESVADGALIAKLRYPGSHLTPDDAIAQYRGELMESHGTDFIPYTFQLPISIVVAKVDAQYRLMDLVALDEPAYRPHMLTSHFWRGWEAYKRPTWVTFNGRTFDMPLLELAAFRYGVNLAGWFDISGKSFENPRNRYNVAAHLDLHDLLTNFGATRFHGGLNLVANLLGKPGKMDVQGFMVQDLYTEGKLAEINDYCRCDVLDTYFVFLRCAVLIGRLTLDQEQEIVATTRQWLEQQSEAMPVYGTYLERWGSWENPWEAPA